MVESACLTPDLGHPPFGHAGERTLHRLMRPYGGFEGNAQTLRIITEIFYRADKERRGMNPTRAFIDSILKYKSLYGNLVDSISGGFITIFKLLKWKEANESGLTTSQVIYLDEIIEWMKRGNFKPKFGSQIGEFINACGIIENNEVKSDLTNRYNYKLSIEENFVEKVKLYKKISADIVFKSSQLHQIEYKGDKMLSSIFKVLEENYIKSVRPTKLLPDFSDRIIRNEKDELKRARLVCDQLAGMTDSFAMRNYKRLFDPDYSSLTDMI